MIYSTESLDHLVSESNKIEQAYGSDWHDRHLRALLACRIAAEQQQVLHPRVVHYILMDGKEIADNGTLATPGEYRKYGAFVYLSNSAIRSFIHPSLIVKEMEDFWSLTWSGSRDPWQAHVHFESIHPFSDGNGRVGRCLLWNLEMIQRGALTEITYQDRMDYYQRLENSRLVEV